MLLLIGRTCPCSESVNIDSLNAISHWLCWHSSSLCLILKNPYAMGLELCPLKQSFTLLGWNERPKVAVGSWWSEEGCVAAPLHLWADWGTAAHCLNYRHSIHADTLFVHKLQKNLLTRRCNHIRSLLNHTKKKKKKNRRIKRAHSLSTPTTLPKSSAFYDLIVNPQEWMKWIWFQWSWS